MLPRDTGILRSNSESRLQEAGRAGEGTGEPPEEAQGGGLKGAHTHTHTHTHTPDPVVSHPSLPTRHSSCKRDHHSFCWLLEPWVVHSLLDLLSSAMSKQDANGFMNGEATMTCHRKEETSLGPAAEGEEEKVGKKQEIVWRNVILMALLHMGAVYALFLIPKAHLFTLIWAYVCFLLSALGVTAGAHRLWSHRSYKAKLPLRIFLAVVNSMAFQNDIFEWSRDHRVHHKFSETDADPHNARRGFFFSHIGWLFVRKHQEVIEKGRKLDYSDLLEDPVVMFQRKHYKISVVLMCFVVPTLVPWYFWRESLWNSYFLASILRYTISLNVAWLVNSAAHMYGNRPYDKNINPRQNTFVSFGAIGEGFHNYHHTFPFDYSASELGLKFNPTTWFIDFMFWLGLVTDRKQTPKEMVEARKERTGDGSL